MRSNSRKNLGGARTVAQDMAGRYVKKKYGKASNFQRIYAVRFITSGFP
jgi:hypothetical protein